MRVTITSPADLTEQQISRWRELQSADSTFDSPFFCPEFTKTVAEFRPDVEVAVLKDEDRTLGFFPYERLTFGRARPVAAAFNEFHGVIVAQDMSWSVAELLKQCRISSWAYDHVPVRQKQFSEYHRVVGQSPYIDLSDGFGAYGERKRISGSKVITQTARKLRKLGREVGKVRLEVHRPDELGIERLISWKSAQHRRTGVLDVFQFEWVVGLVKAIRDVQTESFQGLLSILYAGRLPVAVHLGMRSGTVAHMWYPAFDPKFARYSPGLVLFVELARELAASGVQRIDFGPGPQRYKQSLMSGSIPVAIGCADRTRLVSSLRHGMSGVRKKLRTSPLRTQVSAPAQMLFRVRQWLEMR